jgi:hypothetical protein
MPALPQLRQQKEHSAGSADNFILPPVGPQSEATFVVSGSKRQPLYFGNNPLENETSTFPPLLVHITIPKVAALYMLGGATRSQLETAIMNPRLDTMAVLCRELAIPASALGWIAAFGRGD